MADEQYLNVDGMPTTEYDEPYSAEELGLLAKIAGDAGISTGLRALVKPVNNILPTTVPLATAAFLQRLGTPSRAAKVAGEFVKEIPASVAHAGARGAETYADTGSPSEAMQRMAYDAIGAAVKPVQIEYFRVPQYIYEPRRIFKATIRQGYKEYNKNNGQE